MPTLDLNDEIPGIPAEFHHMLYHAMAVDDDIILRFPKAQSYAPDNQARYDAYFRDLAAWNASLVGATVWPSLFTRISYQVGSP